MIKMTADYRWRWPESDWILCLLKRFKENCVCSIQKAKQSGNRTMRSVSMCPCVVTVLIWFRQHFGGNPNEKYDLMWYHQSDRWKLFTVSRSLFDIFGIYILLQIDFTDADSDLYPTWQPINGKHGANMEFYFI